MEVSLFYTDSSSVGAQGIEPRSSGLQPPSIPDCYYSQMPIGSYVGSFKDFSSLPRRSVSIIPYPALSSDKCMLSRPSLVDLTETRNLGDMIELTSTRRSDLPVQYRVAYQLVRPYPKPPRRELNSHYPLLRVIPGFSWRSLFRRLRFVSPGSLGGWPIRQLSHPGVIGAYR